MVRRISLSLLCSALLLGLVVVTPVGRTTAARAQAADPLLAALDIDPATVAALTVSSDADSILATSAVLGGFPTQQGDYLVLSTGRAADVAGGTADEFISTDVAGVQPGADGNDLTALRVRLRPPDGATCIGFDFRFLSEEYPEYVGSSFNDIFTAELNESQFTVDGNQVIAPNNFAFDTEGNLVSINTVFGLAPMEGTRMDGVTPPLAAVSPIELNDNDEVEVIFSVQDLGDSIYDSAVLVDNLRWLFGADCDRGAVPLTDTDGDDLPDSWETEGIDYDNDGTPELDLPAMGADPNHKDIFVEVDWMDQPPSCIWFVCWGGRNFAPQQGALDDVRAAFAAAPVGNPDGASGIRLHIDSGAGSVMNPVTNATWGDRSRAGDVPHDTDLGAFAGNDYNWSEFEGLKGVHFETVRRDAFHYVIYGDTVGGRGYSGISRGIPGSDLIVSDGHPSWEGGFSRAQERGTFMHELGHNLGLGHGGGDGVGYKPNYLSVMNYWFQLDGLRPGVGLDFSRAALSPLNEAALSEAAGLEPDDAIGGRGTTWSCGAATRSSNSPASNVDWNCSDAVDPGPVAANLNHDHDQELGILNGFDDWRGIRFDGGSVGDLGESAPLPEVTEADELDPASARAAGVYAAPGDGLVEALGPSVLLSGVGDRPLLFDVTNISEQDDTFTLKVETNLPLSRTEVTADVKAGATSRLEMTVDTSGLAPGTYPVLATLSSSLAGEALSEARLEVVVPDLDDPAVRKAAEDAFAELRDLPAGSGLDPGLAELLSEMFDASELGNKAPVAKDASITAQSGAATSFELEASDPDGDPLTFTVATQPSHGVVTGTGPTFTYSSADGYVGPDSFSVAVSDGTATATATVTVEVVAPEQATWKARLRLRGDRRLALTRKVLEPEVGRGRIIVTTPPDADRLLTLEAERIGHRRYAGRLRIEQKEGVVRTLRVRGYLSPSRRTFVGIWRGAGGDGTFVLRLTPPPRP